MLTIPITATPAPPTAAAGTIHSQEPPQPAPLGSGVNGGAAGRVERAAHRTGVDAASVERLPFDLSALEEEGAFINVDASGFGMLDRRLDWQALGLTLPRESGIAFHPARCGLLPDRYRLPLLRPAGRAHTALNRYSFRFTLTETLFETPAYRWVPWRAFESFEKEFDAARAALRAAQEDVLDHYDALREEVLATFVTLADDSARRLEATGQAVPEGFHSAVVQGVLRAMPGPDDIRDRLVLHYRVGVVLLGSEMVEEQRRTREARHRLEAADAAAALDRRRHEAQAHLVQQELWAEQERLRRRLEAEEQERQREAAVKDRLRQLKVEAARERLQDAMSPLEEGAKQLHAAVYEAAAAIRESLQKHEALRGASAKRARELARWFRVMNWRTDDQLDELIAELERLATQPTGKRKRETGPVDQVLGDIIALTFADARALAEPNRMQALEL
jgi:hypothetical protein